MISKKHNELIHGNNYTHKKAEMSENNSAITKHWNEVLRLNQDEVRVSEEDILKNFPWNYGELTQRLKLRYTNFKVNNDYHKIRKTIENEQKFCRTRYLDPKKKNNGQQKKFYSTGIFFGVR